MILDGKQTVFFSSCENMKELDDHSIDVIVTSPPYNIGKLYHTDSARYDDRQDYSDYLEFLSRVFSECYRVLSSKGVFFLNIGDSARDQGKSEDVVRCAVKVGFRRLQTIIWVKSVFGKGHYSPSGGDRRLNNVWEFIFVLVKKKDYQINPKAIGIPYADKSNIGRYSDVDLRDAGDVWFIPYAKTTGIKVKKGHDAPFPVELPLRCLKLVANARTVLDPFLGTGSTLRAAKELDLAGFGYELFPQEDIIRNTLNEPLSIAKTPLLPQLELYSEILSLILENALELIPPEQIKRLVNSLSLQERRSFKWACKDLEKSPSVFQFILGVDEEPEDSKLGKKPRSRRISDYIETE
jgi:site-specific DNA-methyltransferase (adenine-specific)